MATKTYEINTDKGVQTLQAENKQAAIASLQTQGFAYQPKPIAVNEMVGATPLKVAPPPVSSVSAGVTGLAEGSLASTDAINARLTADFDSKQKATQTSGQAMERTMQQILGVQQSVPQVEADLKVNEFGQMKNEAYNALQASQRAQQKEVQAALDAAGGLREGAAQSIQQINRRYAFEQADLAIALDVSNRNYLSAQATADRKIQMQLEPLQTLLNFQREFYRDNKDDLSKAEDRQLQLLITQNQREYEAKKSSAEILQKTKLSIMQMAQQNQAPAAVMNAIQAAATPEAALAAAGQYGSDMLERRLKEAQIASANRANRPDPSPSTKIVKINGTDYVQNADGSYSLPNVPKSGQDAASVQRVQEKVAKINNLINSKALGGAVGPNPLARSEALDVNYLTGARSGFIADIKQLTSELTLDKLIAAKDQGAAFGALSDAELALLAQSASRLATWEVKDGKGNVTGYNTSETEFKKELETIRSFTERSATTSYLQTVDELLQEELGNPYSGYLTD